MPTQRQPRKKRSAAPMVKLDLNLDLGLNLETDFDPDDFDDEPEKRPRGKRQRDVRILRPRVDKCELFTAAVFENAEAFARQLCLEPGARIFAFVSGSFIFGDIVEALITARRVGVRRLYASSLSASQDVIDSLVNVKQLMGDELTRLVLLFSGWEYSRQKYGLVPYMYNELDDAANRVQIAFGRYHCKLICIETVTGRTITIHGSANLCSSNSIEQIMVEVDNRELFDFCVDYMERAAARFGTINYGKPWTQLTPVSTREAWELCEEG